MQRKQVYCKNQYELEVEMNESINLKKIQQKVIRESQQDGITEIFMGMFLFYYTFIFDNICNGVKPGGPVVIFFIITCVYPIIHFNLIRNVFTYPRMGYVNIKEKVSVGFILTVILPLIIIPIFMYVIVFLFNDFPNIAMIIKWVVVVYGLIFGALYFSYVKRYGKNFYYILATFSVIAGIVLSQVSLAVSGAAILILLNGFILLFYGVYMLIRFALKYPKPKKTQTEQK